MWSIQEHKYVCKGMFIVVVYVGAKQKKKEIQKNKEKIE